MSFRQSLARSVDAFLFRVSGKLPANRLMYRYCKHYIDRYNGDNNPYFERNGELHWLSTVLEECRIVFDVGANIGDWTEIALSLNPRLQIHCFEPSLATFQRLQARPYVDERVILNQFGMSSSVGEASFYVFGEASGGNSIYHREVFDTDKTQIETIQLDTLDDYCARKGIEHVDLVKIDVEGNELKVLQGAERLLSQGAIKYIQFEYGGTYIDAHILLKDIFELFQTYDYQLYKIFPNTIRAFNHYDPALENFQYQNWIAERPAKTIK